MPIIWLLAAALIAGLLILCPRRVKEKKPVPRTGEEPEGLEPVSGPTKSRNGMARSAVAVAQVESFILKNGDGGELALNRPDTALPSAKKYRELGARGTSAAAQVAQGAMPVLAQAKTLNEIAKAAPNGLFTATVSAEELMRYKDGTIASIVQKNGRYSKHSGFTEVAVDTANPAAVIAGAMQGMALVSGQYYMDQLSKQLESVAHKLDKLIGYHHDEKIAILKSANRELCTLTAKINVDAADIISCQRIAEKCGEVYFEYHTRLERVDIRAKERWLNKSKELRELDENLDDSELDFSIQMCYRASALMETCKLAEIAVRMKIGDGQERFISEQLEALRQTGGEAFHHNLHRYVDEHYEPVLGKAKKIAKSKKIPLLFGDAKKAESVVRRRKEAVLQTVKADENEETLVHELVDSMCRPRETLILLGETPDTSRVFVLDEVEANSNR